MATQHAQLEHPIRRAAPPRRHRRRALDPSSLEAELRRTVEGEVRFDADRRVVVPRTKLDVAATHAICRRFGAPIVPRGHALDGPAGGVLLDMSRLDMILELDPEGRFACVEPGVLASTLVEAARPHGLTFGPCASSAKGRATVGAIIGAGAAGIDGPLYGDAADNVEELEILLADGTRMRVGWTTRAEMLALAARGGRAGRIYGDLVSLGERHGEAIRRRTGKLASRVSGYDLRWLVPDRDGRVNVARALAGSEGTLCTILEAKVLLSLARPERAVVIAGFEDAFAAADAVPAALEHAPMALEGMDWRLRTQLEMSGGPAFTRGLDLLPDGKGWLFVELGAHDADDARDAARAVVARLAGATGIVATTVLTAEDDLARLRRTRASAFGDEASAVPPGRLGGYLRELDRLLASYGWSPPLSGHFGRGRVCSTVSRGFASPEARARFDAYLADAADLAASHGGALAGARPPELERSYGPELFEAFRRFKAIWDPDGAMSPARSVAPWPVSRPENERATRRQGAVRSSLLRAGVAASAVAAYAAYVGVLARALVSRRRASIVERLRRRIAHAL